MNIDVMNSDLFDNTFKTFWTKWEQKIHDYTSKKRWWELTKIKIKEISIQVAKQLSKEDNIKLSKTNKELNLEKNSNRPNHEKIDKLTKDLNEIWQKRTNGARIRSRIKIFEEGEKSTKFFYSQEKTRSRSKLWHQIKDDKGKIKIGIDKILQEQVSFYTNLMSSEGWDKDAANQLK